MTNHRLKPSRKSLWDSKYAARLDPVGRLIYRSNLLGSDPTITNTGGGNTSSKILQTDPLSGASVDVLWVKGSGGDLRTSTKENFASLYMSGMFRLREIYLKSKPNGPKSKAEDDMVALFSHCTFNLNPRSPSIDTPLHAFVPYRHVDHTHPNAVIAIAAAAHSQKLTEAIYGDEVLWMPWQRPGFDLGLKLQTLCIKNPQVKGVVLGQHGLINWANDDRACFELTVDLIEKAERYIQKRDRKSRTFGGFAHPSLSPETRKEIFSDLLPWLRGQVSSQRRLIGTIQDDDATLQFVNSRDAARLSEKGTSCPDHFLRTKIKPLFVPWNPRTNNLQDLKSKLEQGLLGYRKDYNAYYQKCKRSGSPALRDTNPTIILIPGLGMIAWGKDKSESRVTAEFFSCAIEVMRGSEALDQYVSLPPQEAFDIEYWALEEAKLKRMPPEKEMARQIVAVIGAGSGIGKTTAHRLSREGAHVVCVDLQEAAAQATASEIIQTRGMGIGLGGSGISHCGPAIGLQVDITQRASIKKMLQSITLAYGGLDGIALTAGIFITPNAQGKIPDDKWNLTFSINVMGGYLVADEASRLWKEQRLKSSFVLTTSANAVVPKRGSVAYDTSKAAANHLVRELAMELSPWTRVNGVAPATVIKGSSMFPRDRVIAALSKYELKFSNSESDDSLRDKLAQFYANRTLSKCPITTEDQSEAIYLLLGERLSKTTGQILAVDGGLHEAFLR